MEEFDMSTLQLILAIACIVFAIVLTVIILMQKNREADASAVQGSNPMNDNQFFDKTGGHAKDSALGNATKVLGIVFVVLCMATTLVILFVK